MPIFDDKEWLSKVNDLFDKPPSPSTASSPANSCNPNVKALNLLTQLLDQPAAYFDALEVLANKAIDQGMISDAMKVLQMETIFANLGLLLVRYRAAEESRKGKGRLIFEEVGVCYGEEFIILEQLSTIIGGLREFDGMK